MAWLDDRIWCHPKFNSLSSKAFRVHINGIVYSSGFGTKGILRPADQRKIGSTSRTKTELVLNQFWDLLDDGIVRIHDWDEHNSRRDAKRLQDRERKRRQREREDEESRGKSRNVTRDKQRDRRGLTEVKEVTDEGEPENTTAASPENALPELDLQALPNYEGHEYKLWKRLCVAAGVANKPEGIRKLENTRRAHLSTEREIVMAIEAATGPGVNDPLAVALSELKKLALERKRGAA